MRNALCLLTHYELRITHYVNNLHRPMFARRLIARINECHRFQIIFATERWLVSAFQCDQQVGHWADEGIREPDVVPSGLIPLTLITGGCEVQRGGRARGIAGPADGAARQALGAFDAPADADVGCRAFERGAGPYVVPR